MTWQKIEDQLFAPVYLARSIEEHVCQQKQQALSLYIYITYIYIKIAS